MGGRFWKALLLQQPAILLDFKFPKLPANLKTRVMLCSQLPVGLAGGFFYSHCSHCFDFLTKLRFWWRLILSSRSEWRWAGKHKQPHQPVSLPASHTLLQCLHGVWRVKVSVQSRTVNTSYFHQVKLDKISIGLAQVTGNSVPSPSAFRNRFTLPQAKPAVLRLLWSERLTEWLTFFFI